jgi:hypothetical protein
MRCSKPVNFRDVNEIRISDVPHPNIRLDFRDWSAYLVVVRRSKAPEVPEEPGGLRTQPAISQAEVVMNDSISKDFKAIETHIHDARLERVANLGATLGNALGNLWKGWSEFVQGVDSGMEEHRKRRTTADAHAAQRGMTV